jgi:choline dehydrogenase
VVSLEVSGRQVNRVRFQQDGQTRAVAGAQVVLCAGAYHSPQLLMLSGIGPAAELERHGIPVVHALPGVGENYQDHAVVYLTFEGPTDIREDWIVPKFRLLVKSDPTLPCANFHIMMRPLTVVQGLKRMAPISLHLLEQRSRGRVSLQSTDPFDLPVVNARLLEDEQDLEAMTWAMRFVHDLVQHPSTSAFYGPLLQPAPRDDWATFARSTMDSYHHGAGTCMMGPASNNLAVVDQKLRVHGLDNLWIADASVMPVVAHANTNLTAIMIGERVLDFFAEAQL